MKKAKKILVATVCVFVSFVVASCGNPYSSVKFDDYLKLAEYKGIEIKKDDSTITDEMVEQEIQRRLEAKKTSKDVKTGVVKDGDSINIDYVGSINGEKFAGGEEKGRTLVIGSKSFIDGFESSLIGAKVGTTKNIKVRFPDDYGEKSLAGKNAVFAVTINSKKEYTVPELNEDFVKANSDSKTVEDYKKKVREELEEQLKDSQDEKYRQVAWNEVISKSEIIKDDDGNEKYPEKQLKEFIDETLKVYEDRAKKENMSLEDFVKKNFQMEEEKFKEEINAYGKIQVKIDMVLYDIASKENISVSSKEYDEFIDYTLKKFGYTKESFEKANNGKSYETIVGKDKIKQEALRKKVQDFIVKEAKFV